MNLHQVQINLINGVRQPQGEKVQHFLLCQPGEQDLKQSDNKTDYRADDFHKSELFGHNLKQDFFKLVGGKACYFLDYEMFQVEFGTQVGRILFHDHGKERLNFHHKSTFQFADRFIPYEHADHRHFLLNAVPEKVIYMAFNKGHDFFQVIRVTDPVFDILVREEFITHQPAQFLRKLLLSFWKNTLQGYPQETPGFTGMKKHFYGDPVGHPSDKSRNKRNQKKPVIHNWYKMKPRLC